MSGMSDNITTIIGHVAIIIVAVCNLVATLYNRKNIRKLGDQVNGKDE